MSQSMSRLVSVLTIGLCLTAGYAAFSGKVFAQGYQGLIAPDEKEAPVQAVPQKKGDEPLGYQGLIPGKVPATPKQDIPAITAQQPVPSNTVQPNSASVPNAAAGISAPDKIDVDTDRAHALQMTPIPDSVMKGLDNTVQPMDRLRQIAKTSGFGREVDKAPSGLGDSVRAMLPKDGFSFLNEPTPRNADGLTPDEAIVQKKINKALALAADKSLPPQEREQKLAAAIEKLSNSARVLHMEADAPAWIGPLLGVPQSYMDESRDTSKRSLQRIQDALREIRKYEQ